MTEQPTNTAWIPMYTPDGGKINFTINLDTPLTDVQVQVASAAYAALIAAGLSPREPGLEDGEHSEVVHYVVRRVKKNEDGTTTPIIDLYVDKLKFRFMGVYLNTTEDIAAFEGASGLKLTDLPIFRSQAPLKRGDDDELDAQYLRPMPRPATVIFKLNPNATEDNKEAKRKFVRWQGTTAPAVNVDTAREHLNNGDNRQAVVPLKDWYDWEPIFKVVETWIEGKDYPARKAHFWNIVKLLAREEQLVQGMSVDKVQEVIIANRQAKVTA